MVMLLLLLHIYVCILSTHAAACGSTPGGLNLFSSAMFYQTMAELGIVTDM